MSRASPHLPYIAAFLAGCTAGQTPEAALPPLPPRVEKAELPRGPEKVVRELTIALTGEVRGEIEACGCPTVPYGGFGRRAALLESVRAEGVPLFVLDAGQMLLKGESAADPVDRGARARTVLSLARQVGLQAWAASRVDVSVGQGALLREGGALAANWAGWPTDRVLTEGGVRLQVFGLGDTPVAPEAPRDPVAAIRAAMVPDLDGYVVISSASDEENQRVAEAIPTLGAILATKGEHVDPPRTTLGAPIIETPDRGRYVTLVRAALGSVPGPWHLDEAGVIDHVADQRGLLGHHPDAKVRPTLEAQLAGAQATLQEAARGRNLFQVKDHPLGSSLDGPSALDSTITAFKAETVQAAAAVVAAPQGPHQAGAGACASCHSARMAQWTFEPHAHALDPLVKAGKTGDTECITCHTTGFGRPGGFSKLEEVGVWKGVQCEACHGPLGGHPADRSVTSAPVTEATCLRCHDKANSPQFDYATWLPRIACSVATKLDPQRR